MKVSNSPRLGLVFFFLSLLGGELEEEWGAGGEGAQKADAPPVARKEMAASPATVVVS